MQRKTIRVRAESVGPHQLQPADTRDKVSRVPHISHLAEIVNVSPWSRKPRTRISFRTIQVMSDRQKSGISNLVKSSQENQGKVGE